MYQYIFPNLKGSDNVISFQHLFNTQKRNRLSKFRSVLLINVKISNVIYLNREYGKNVQRANAAYCERKELFVQQQGKIITIPITSSLDQSCS
jgi:hypothetical protein